MVTLTIWKLIWCVTWKNAFFFETVDHWTKWAMASIAMLSYQRVSGAKTTQTSFN
jgi:hypothetical protein